MTTFESIWPQFEQEKNDILTRKKVVVDEKKSKINMNEAIEELLQLTRSQTTLISNPERLLPLDYLKYAIRSISRYDVSIGNFDEEFYLFLNRLIENLTISNVKSNVFEDIYMIIQRMQINDKRWSVKYKNLFMELIFEKIKEKSLG